MPIKTRISLAHAFIFPILDYADSCYPDVKEGQLKNISSSSRQYFIETR